MQYSVEYLEISNNPYNLYFCLYQNRYCIHRNFIIREVVLLVERLRYLLPGYEIIDVSMQNVHQVMEIYNSNYDYFMLSDGEPANMENCLLDIAAIPSDFNTKNKKYIGIWKHRKIIAILDFLMGYPDKKCCWIGLLLVDAKWHGKGTGTEIINAFVKASILSGYSHIQLGVLDTNKKAIAFWKRLGFLEIRKSNIKRPNKPDWNVIVMEKSIA